MFIFLLVNWTLNFNYWTGGVHLCDGKWGWCLPDGSPAPFAPDLEWDSNQPDNKTGNETCVQMKIYRNATGIKLHDKNCSNKFIFACQVSEHWNQFLILA
jgi:Lectin C-type domain